MKKNKSQPKVDDYVEAIQEESTNTISSSIEPPSHNRSSSYTKIKGGFDMQKMKQNAAREARVKLNQMVNKDVKIDYLTESREMRKLKQGTKQEIDWKNIVRTAMMN